MPRGVRRIVLVLAAVVASLAAAAAVAAPPAVDAEAYLVVNGRTGEVLASRNAAERVPMASITKLMTVLVALEHARPEDVVTVGPSAASIGESTINLRAGERLTVRDLITAALVQSANDAATALAAGVAGGSVERFVGWMNERAASLGLHETHFVNPNGLDAPGHVSSARDLTRLARIAMRNPVVRETVTRRTASIAGGRSVSTWNDLLGAFPGTIGVKTGHTSGAGWSEVAAARRNGVTLYATVLGSPGRSQRNDDLVELLSWGIARYRLVRLVDGSRVYATAATGYGRPAVRLVAERQPQQIVRVDRPLREVVVAPSSVALPVARGERLGEVRVYAGSKLLARSPLVASASISEPGAWGKTRWYAGRTLHHLWDTVTP
jgi:serine-type D-Ala-D-Ala carboxypeptidase (penicillin-binding protein 5/6)